MMGSLDKILIEEEVIVKKIKGEESLKRRFLDLGFLPNEKVKCVLVSPFKDPKAYLIRGQMLAIRNNDAKNIEVEYARN